MRGCLAGLVAVMLVAIGCDTVEIDCEKGTIRSHGNATAQQTAIAYRDACGGEPKKVTR